MQKRQLFTLLTLFLLIQGCFMGGKPTSEVDANTEFLEKMMYYTEKKIGKNEDTTLYTKKIDSLLELSRIHLRTGKIYEAFDEVNMANLVADTIGSAWQLARCYYHLGMVSAKMGNVSISDKNYYSCLIYHQKMKDRRGVSALCRSWARSYYENNIFDSAKSFLNNYCMKIDIATNNNKGLKTDYTYVGQMLLKMYRIDPIDNDLKKLNIAYENFKQAQKIHIDEQEKVLDTEELLITGLCETFYYMSKQYEINSKEYNQYADSCNKYYDKALKYIRLSNNMEDFSRFVMLKNDLLIQQGNLKKAKEIADSIFKVADSESYYHKETAYKAYAQIYEKEKNYQKALECQNKANAYQLSNYQYRNSLMTSLKLGRGQMENDKNKSYAKRMAMEGKTRSIMMISTIVTIFIIMFLIMVSISRRRYKRINKIISSQKQEIEISNEKLLAKNEEIIAQNEEITKQSEIIKNYNQELTSSINYASRIQFAALPSQDEIKKIFGEHLLYYKPKDIVSGDFYWVMQTENLKVLAVGDCTGHGVPGALLSMLGISSLEYATRHLEQNSLKASDVLDTMKTILKTTLNQDDFENDNRDAIDLGLIIIDKKNMKMQFAGANRPLIVIRNGEILRTKGDNMPIGVFVAEKEHFTNHIIDIENNDKLYMFSDGITDQLGYRQENDNAEIFTVKRFLNILNESSTMDFDIQKMQIIKELKRWKKAKMPNAETCEQTDDNVLVGVSIKNMLEI